MRRTTGALSFWSRRSSTEAALSASEWRSSSAAAATSAASLALSR